MKLAPRGQGWEYVESLDMPGNAERWASLAAEKLTAKTVEAGQYDLILDPTNLWLTIHESIGHPTELDRAAGQEANYAGTSFVAPPEKVIGKLRYGPEFMNVEADRTQEGSLSRVAWDDEGIPADRWLIVDKGIFKDYQTTREQAKWIEHLTGVNRSHGCSFAQSWDAVQFQRMPNISLLPGEQDISLDDIVSATDRGILIKNRGSWSIDNQRYNFQFSGQAYYEVRNGKIAGMLRDVAYQSNTPVFWSSLDMIGGKSSYWLGGSFNDGKGEPAQVELGEPRLPAVSIPQHHDSQHRAEVMTREEAKALCDRVLALSKGEQTRVNITSQWSGNTRFADASITTSGGVTDIEVTVTVTIGRKRASAKTNVIDEPGLRRTVELAAQLARLSPDDPELMPELGPQTYASVNAHIEDTANLNPVARAGAIQRAIAATGGKIFSAGFLEANAIAVAVATSSGLFAYHRTTDAKLSMTARTPDGTGSGWASAGSRDWGKVDPSNLGQVAARKALASRNPQAIEPRPYTAVLEPQAVNDLVPLLSSSLNARNADEGRSAFSKAGGGTRIGEKVCDQRITLVTDPADPQLLGMPFDVEGLPIRRTVWIEKGVLRNLAYSRFWAQKQNAQPAGDDIYTGASAFTGGGLKLIGGTKTTEELVAGCEYGVLVTHFFYIRSLDARTVLYTGLTRDGAFLIEKGKVTRPLKNLRWNESPLLMLNRLEDIGRPEAVAAGRLMPALRIKDFNFTSLSDAV